MTILVLLPILLPLGYALAEVGLSRWLARNLWSPIIRLVGLVIATISFLVVPALTPGAFAISSSIPGLLSMPPIAFQYTSTGTVVALIYGFSRAAAAVDSTLDSVHTSEHTKNWLILALVNAACLAANIYTISVIWICASVIMLSEFQQKQNTPAALAWNLLMVLVPIILLVVAVVYYYPQSSSNSFVDISNPLLIKLLMSASFIMMSLYPLPEHLQQDWSRQSAGVCIGAGLYLRVASLSSLTLPGGTWLVPLLAISSFIPSLLAVLSPDRDKLRYVFISLTSALVLGPLVEPTVGTGLAVLYLVIIVLLPTILLSKSANLTERQAHIHYWLSMISLVVMIGAPFSLGMLTRWELQLLTGYSQRGTMLLLALSHLFVTLSLWQSIKSLQPYHSDTNIQLPAQTRVINWTKCSISGLVVLGVLVLGIAPSIINMLLPTPLTFPSTAFFREGIAVWIYPLVTTFIIPLAGSFFILYQRSGPNSNPEVLKTAYRILRLDWMYLGLSKLLGKVAKSGERLIQAIETRYLLGWELVWILVIILASTGNQ